jgi:hypothetical protein
MKTQLEISNRAQEIMNHVRKSFIKQRLTRTHQNCIHNRRCCQRAVDFRYCNLKTEADDDTKIKRLFVCDSDDWSTNCQEFSNKTTKKEAEQLFYDIVMSPSRCGQTFPHLAALLWTLNESAPRSEKQQETPRRSLLQRVRDLIT